MAIGNRSQAPQTTAAEPGVRLRSSSLPALESLRISGRLPTRHDAVLAWCRGPSVLNLGCAQREYPHVPGEPYWLHGHLETRFERVVGVDIDPEAVRRLREQGHDVREGDVERLSLGERFETVVAGELIEHLANPGKFLDAARRHLAPGGRLIVTTPNPFALVYVGQYWRKGQRAAWNPDHTLWMDAVVARRMVERHGFRVVAVQYATDYLTRPGVKYRAFVRAARTLAAMLPTAAVQRLFANNVVVVAEPVSSGPPRGARAGRKRS